MSKPRFLGHFLLASMTIPLLAGGACEKKPTSDTGAINAADRVGSGSSATVQGPVDTTPLKGVDLKLDGDKATTFYRLIGSLTSPCGKSESLRTSFTNDTSCKRAPFAIRYVMALLEDEVTEDKVREFYVHKYQSTDPPVKKIDTSKAPRVGSDDARVKLVEFFDYQCPICQRFKPQLDKVEKEYEGKFVIYYMMYPIHAGAPSASAAALAANAQGKFKPMHDMLYARSPAHSRDDVVAYAKELGLDVAKFEADYDKAISETGQVQADRAAGQAVGVNSTPTMFFNDRIYEGPQVAKYVGMWIDEELAVNR